MPTTVLILLSFLGHLTILTAQPPKLRYRYCLDPKGSSYTNTSTYQTNLNTLLSDLTSNTQIDYGFYNLSYGQDPDRVSAIGLCRGDVKPNECRSCINNASILLPKSCPNQKEAMGGYDQCMLRYSNRSIFGVMESDVSLYLLNVNKAAEPDKFNQVVSDLLKGLIVKASNGDSLRKYAAANESGLNFQTVFGAVQCTPDLSQQDCSDCLMNAISKIPICCLSRIGARVINPSCNVRYEIFSFYDPVADGSPPPASPTSTSKGNRNRTSRVVFIVAVLIIGAFITLH